MHHRVQCPIVLSPAEVGHCYHSPTGSNRTLSCAPAMETYSEKHEKDSRGHDSVPSSALMEPVLHRSGDRSYPPGMGLRPKACPWSRNATTPTTWSERPIQGQVDRCLTLVLLCPNVGSLVSCVEHPAIAPWVNTLSGWQTTILRTCVVSMIHTSYVVSKQ